MHTKCSSSQIFTNLLFVWNSHLCHCGTGFQSRLNHSLPPLQSPFSPGHMVFDVCWHLESSRLCQRQQHQGHCHITWGSSQHEGRYPHYWVGCYLKCVVILPLYLLLCYLLNIFHETLHRFLNLQNPQNPYPQPTETPTLSGRYGLMRVRVRVALEYPRVTCDNH